MNVFYIIVGGDGLVVVLGGVMTIMMMMAIMGGIADSTCSVSLIMVMLFVRENCIDGTGDGGSKSNDIDRTDRNVLS